ncbi:MAG: hypothetical protein PUG54_00670 [Firmicutes bacterium]|nr:hypothetical protein [Bacillota bacterium]
MQLKKVSSNDNSTNNFLIFSIIMLLISLAFYLFFAFFDGAVICVDSPSYIEMNISREPAYPLLLALFRFIFSGFSSDFYLTAVAFFQSILAAFAAWSFASFLMKEFRLTRLFSMFALCIPFFVSLLCRFAAKRGSMYSNSILTEGITISLYFIFFRYLIDFILHQKKKHFAFCWLLTFLMISTRKQMMIALAMLIIAILLIGHQKKKYLKAILFSLISSASILLCSSLLDFGYNYAVRGEFIKHSSDTRFITTMAFYTAEREDAYYIEDSEIQELFLKIYDICNENGYLKNSAGNGWLNRVTHFGDHYDHIQIDTMWPLINQYAETVYGNDTVSINTYADQIMNIINRSVLLHHLPEIAETFMDNFLSGLVTTVAQRNSILIWYSLLVYLLYIILLIWHVRHDQNRTIVLFSSLTLISILLNVGLVSMVIFCQTRYTIYNMALFYISLLLMLYEPFYQLLGRLTKHVSK